MSAQTQPSPVSAGPRRESIGSASAGVQPQSQAKTNVRTGQGGSGTQGSQQNLNQIVIEYLNKKGYQKTEAILRQESAQVDLHGKPQINRAEDEGGRRFFKAFALLSHWIDENLEIYKAELRRILWPIFVYSFLTLVTEYYPELAGQFFELHSEQFQEEHAEDLRALKPVNHPDHIESNAVSKAYRDNSYRLTLTTLVFYSLVQFLEAKEKDGGSVLLTIIQNSMHIVTVDRAAAGKSRDFAAMIKRLHGEDDIPDEDEGIPGHNPGSANTARDAPKALPKLALGQLPQDKDMETDIRDDIEDEDAKNPPLPGQNSLIDELDQQIKREPSEDAPTREAVPLPVPLARDVAMEVQRIKEYRDRYRFNVEPKSGGIGPGVSVTMFTFHNTFDSVNCIDFSGDNALVAVGTAESYIRVWSLEGKPLPSLVSDGSDTVPNSSRRLIGHSGPVYAVSFSPSVSNDNPDYPDTNSRYLLSCSADRSARLWSLDTWSCLVVYKGHDHPVWDITWGPYGHYFLTGSHDHTARLWSTDHVAPLRIFAGHDRDVDCIAFHPNNVYIFTGSSDKTVRMWDVSRGTPVRIFTGHTSNVTAVACASNGRILASADDSGAIILWDLAKGSRIKRMRGHSKGGIWSLAWSVESTILVSGGADNTVRVWDVLQQTEGAVQGKTGGDGAVGGKTDGTTTSGISGVGAGKKSKGKEVTVTPDQISAFLTKKIPVYKVRFTNMNLVLAGGAYLP